MKQYVFISLLLAIVVSGCNQEELGNQQTLLNNDTFTASFESTLSRTYIEDGAFLRWTAGDKISIFDGSTLNEEFKFSGATGDNSGTFDKVNSSYGTGNILSCNYGVYPYNKSTRISENGELTITLPAEQTYAQNSFGLGANVMVAATSDTQNTFLPFKNVGGYLKLQLYGVDTNVKSVSISGNQGETLAGTATVMASYGENPSLNMVKGGSSTITLNCGNGVRLGNTVSSATDFWIVLPPTTFNQGFTITVIGTDGREYTKSTDKTITIERNVILPMTALEVVTVVPSVPTVNMPIIEGVTATTAELSTSYTGKITSLGIEYSIYEDFSNSMSVTTGNESLDVSLRNLSENTIYYARTFGITNSGETITSDAIKFVPNANHPLPYIVISGEKKVTSNCECGMEQGGYVYITAEIFTNGRTSVTSCGFITYDEWVIEMREEGVYGVTFDYSKGTLHEMNSTDSIINYSFEYTRGHTGGPEDYGTLRTTCAYATNEYGTNYSNTINYYQNYATYPLCSMPEPDFW